MSYGSEYPRMIYAPYMPVGLSRMDDYEHFIRILDHSVRKSIDKTHYTIKTEFNMTEFNMLAFVGFFPEDDNNWTNYITPVNHDTALAIEDTFGGALLTSEEDIDQFIDFYRLMMV